MLSSRNEREEKKRDLEERQRVYLKCFCGELLLFCLTVLLLIDERISILVSDFELREKSKKQKKRKSFTATKVTLFPLSHFK